MRHSRRVQSMLATAAAVLLWVSGPAVPAMADTVVTIDTGSLRGTETGGVESWKGIPFAAPPVGELRWRASQPAAAWGGIRDADGYGSDCMQVLAPIEAAPAGSTEPAEDCLYLNVWRPAKATTQPRPVVVYIYGGGFLNGASSPPSYTGAELARQGVVFVNFNYRLGRFGTFAHPQLTAENADRGSLGNYGVLDQIAALQWVKRNIAAFGGDPNNVTLMGESAGGMSVNMLLTSPLAQGLMQRAIIMSGADGAPLQPATLGDVEETGVRFADTQGIAADDPSALAKLRALSAQQVRGDLSAARVFDNRPGLDFAHPFVDGTVVVDQRAAYSSGAFTHVPVMIGVTSADIGGPDGFMITGARNIAGLLAAQGIPVYPYVFSYVADSANHATGALHATDVAFFLDTARIRYGAKTTARDAAVASRISAYVVDFARTGDPNGPGLPTWPRYDPVADPVMEFTTDGDAVAQRDPFAPPP